MLICAQNSYVSSLQELYYLLMGVAEIIIAHTYHCPLWIGLLVKCFTKGKAAAMMGDFYNVYRA